jgi:hypothetical protein
MSPRLGKKGKVERAIGYVRQNFRSQRSFADMSDVNSQARRRDQEIANQRKHRETGQAPCGRFQPETLRPLTAHRAGLSRQHRGSRS